MSHHNANLTPSKTNRKPTSEQALLAILSQIAEKHCHVETLESRGRDSLDFYDVSVVSLKEALLAAYQAGSKAHR
jgi:hypothetical protein